MSIITASQAVTDEDLTTIFGDDALSQMEAGAASDQAESIYDPTMAPAATSWPCVATATFAASC